MRVRDWLDAMAGPDAEETDDDGCNPQDTKADWVGGGHCRLRQHGSPSKLVWPVHPTLSGWRGARRTWATAIFSWSACSSCPRKRHRAISRKTPPSQLSWCAPLLHRTRLSRRDDLVLDACFHQPFHWTHRFRFSSCPSLIFVASFRQRHLETRSPRPSSPKNLPASDSRATLPIHA